MFYLLVLQQSWEWLLLIKKNCLHEEKYMSVQVLDLDNFLEATLPYVTLLIYMGNNNNNKKYVMQRKYKICLCI